jgi:hypothetical protein
MAAVETRGRGVIIGDVTEAEAEAEAVVVAVGTAEGGSGGLSDVGDNIVFDDVLAAVPVVVVVARDGVGATGANEGENRESTSPSGPVSSAI